MSDEGYTLKGEGSASSREEDVRLLLELLEAEQAAAEARLEPDEALPEVDLRTLLSEMTALKAAVRAEATASRDARDRTGEALAGLRDELARAAVREEDLREDADRRLEVMARRAALELVELHDRLEPALDQAREAARPRWRWFRRVAEPAAVALVEGLALTVKRLRRRLEDRGVRPLPTSGVPFSPVTMEVVGVVDRPELDEGVVVEEVTTGWQRDGDERPLRVAQVVVNRRGGGER